MVWGVTLALFLLAALYCLVATRRYQAVGEIEIKKAVPSSLGLESALGIPGPGGEDSLLINIEVQTQTKILQSDALALQVIDELHLEGTDDFRSQLNPLSLLLKLVSPSGPSDPSNAPLRDRPNKRESMLKVFSKRLKVEPFPATRLIDISYLSSDPKTASAVVNRLIQDLVTSSIQGGRGPGGSSHWMDSQLAEMRAESQRLQDKVAGMQQRAGIVSLGTTDTQGREQTYSAILDQLQQISTTLSQAQTNRILKGAVYDVVKTGNPELISGLSGNLSSAASPGISTALNMIQNLRIQKTAEEANLSQMEDKFGSSYPKLEETRVRIAKYDQEIHDEVNRIRERAKNDYKIAEDTEGSARAAYQQLKKQADAVNNSAMDFTIAREEAESSRKLYEDLLSRSKEADLLEGLKTPAISVVDPALVPGKPARPRVLLLLAASILFGLSFGAGGAILMDIFEPRILAVSSMESEFGGLPISVLPMISPQEMDVLESRSSDRPHVQGSYLEALGFLASSLLLSRSTPPPQVIMVTSPMSGEGKTTLSSNLAMLLAEAGKRVLLFDANLRHPGVPDMFRMGNSSGWTELSGSADVNSRIYPVAVRPGLFLLPAGPVSSSPSELLSPSRLEGLLSKCRGLFDFIIVDCASVLTAADSTLVAGHADLALLMGRLGYTDKQALRHSVATLENYLAPDHLRLVMLQGGPK